MAYSDDGGTTDVFHTATTAVKQPELSFDDAESIIAIALSGGANRGPGQVGALKALLEYGIHPRLVTGTSVGAVNGGWFCIDPTLEGVSKLQELWLATRSGDVFPGNRFIWTIKALIGDVPPIPNTALLDYIRRHLPQGITHYRHLRIPLYVTTTDLIANKEMIYGDNPDDPLVETIGASALFPVLIEPLLFQGMQLSDGGLMNFLPISWASALGANEIYAIDLDPGIVYDQPIKGFFNISFRELSAPIKEQTIDDLLDMADDPDVALHHIPIRAFPELDLFDFSKTQQLFDAGYEIAKEYLMDPHPNVVKYDY